jgi:hypothetical protein
MMDEGDDAPGSRLPGWLFLLVLGGVPIIILSFVAVLFDIISHGQATGSPYSADITGRLPAEQHLYQPVQLQFSIRNTGAGIPETVLLFSGLEAWSIESAGTGSGVKGTAVDTLGNGQAWRFGSLRKRETLHVTLKASPVRVGRPLVSVKAFAGVDSSGSPDPTVEIKGDGETWSGISITR